MIDGTTDSPEWMSVADVRKYLRLPVTGGTSRVHQLQDRAVDPLPFVLRGSKDGHRHRLTRKEWLDAWLVKEYVPEYLRAEHLATPQAAIWTTSSQLWDDLVELSNRARTAGVRWQDLPPPPPEEAAEIRMMVLSALRAAIFTRMDELEGDDRIKRLAYEIDVRYRSEARYARSTETKR